MFVLSDDNLSSVNQICMKLCEQAGHINTTCKFEYEKGPLRDGKDMGVARFRLQRIVCFI